MIHIHAFLLSLIFSFLFDSFPFDVVYDILGYTPNVVEDILNILNDQIGNYVFCSSTSVYAPSGFRPVFENSTLSRRPDASDYARKKIVYEDLLLRSIYGARSTNYLSAIGLYLRSAQ